MIVIYWLDNTLIVSFSSLYTRQWFLAADQESIQLCPVFLFCALCQFKRKQKIVRRLWRLVTYICIFTMYIISQEHINSGYAIQAHHRNLSQIFPHSWYILMRIYLTNWVVFELRVRETVNLGCCERGVKDRQRRAVRRRQLLWQSLRGYPRTSLVKTFR